MSADDPDLEPSAALVHKGESAPSTALDAYEKEYMAGGETVLYRDRMVAGTKLNLLLATVALIMIGTAVATGSMMSALIGLPVVALVWLLLGVLRVTVSKQHVDVQYGLFGPKIPIRAIESAVAIKYNWLAFGGWGIRRGMDGWMYNMLGDGGNAVRITWRDGKGQEVVTYIGTKTADTLATEINRAQRALPAADETVALTSGPEPNES